MLALMLINDARRDARFADDTVILLRDQDRSLWNVDQIEEGRAALDRALALGGRAAMSSRRRSRRCMSTTTLGFSLLRSTAARPPDRLAGRRAEPAATLAESGEVVAALELVESLDLDRYHYLHSTQAELLRRLDRVDGLALPTTARSSSSSDPERRFLERRRRASNMSSARAARILARVREIPEGFVRTYGDIDPAHPPRRPGAGRD